MEITFFEGTAKVGQLATITQADLEVSEAVLIKVTCIGVSPYLGNGYGEELKQQIVNGEDLLNVDDFNPEMTAQILAKVEELRELRKDKVEKEMPAEEKAEVERVRAELNELKLERGRLFCEPRIYRNSDGHPCIPHDLLFACLREAGRNHVLEGKARISTMQETRLGMFLNILADDIIMDGDHKWVPDFRVGKPTGRGKKSKKSYICRPRFDNWGFSVTVEFDQALVPITMKTIRALFDDAGANYGLGGFRPGLSTRKRNAAVKQRKRGIPVFAPGHFGRFQVSGWEVVG